MRYHYQKPLLYSSMYGQTYFCNHPVYNICTLYLIGDKGLAVVQQKFNPTSKKTWWGELEPWLIDVLYLHPDFIEYFNNRAKECTDGLYPTVTVRQLMWALKMKPLKKKMGDMF